MARESFGLSEMNARPRLGYAVAAVALAGFLFGFDTAVVSGITDALRRVYRLSPDALGTTVGSALWGTLVGAVAGGVLGQRLGSRAGLRLTAVFYVLSGVGSALAPGWGWLIAFRVMAGLAVGVSSVLAPVYLAEIAPAARRGRLVGVFQLMIVLGILFAYVSNAGVGALVADPDLQWRWKLGATAVPALVFLATMFAVPESPRWLRARGRDAEAGHAAARLYGHADREERSEPVAADPARVTLARLWREAKRPILLAISLAALNQMTGINAILYYLGDIFAAAGFGRLSADLQSIAIGLTNALFTLAGMALIDRVGRRPLLVGGALAMAAMMGVAALVMMGALPKSLLLGVLVVFIASFATTQGAVIWVYLSEIFPTRFRAAGQGIGAGAIWLFDALVAQVFPVLSARSASLPFLLFMGAMLVQFGLVWVAFPETKGVALEDMEARIAGGARGRA